MVAKNKIASLAIFLGLAMLTGSCKEDVSPAFLMSAEVESFGVDRWFIVSDENGRVLDYKQYVSNGVMEFHGASSSQKVIYTTFDRLGWGYMLTSTQAVPVGTQLTLDKTVYPQSPNPPVQGQASFTISDIPFDAPSSDPGYLQYIVGFSGRYWTNNLYSLISPAYQSSSLSFDFPLQTVPADVLGISYRNGIPVYRWFNQIKPGDVLAASFSDFQPEKIIPINKMVSNFGVVGMYGDYVNAGTGHSLSRWEHWYFSGSSDKSKIPMLGYLDGFDNYWINVTLNSPECCKFTENIFFDSFGPVPASIDLPDYTYTLNSQSLHDFSFRFSNDYTYQRAYFTVGGKRSSQTDIWWTINAPKGDKLVQIHIPSEILSKYPDFKAGEIKLNTLSLIKEFGGQTYGDTFFKPANLLNRFQRLMYQFEYD